jgi:hypothetical protein
LKKARRRKYIFCAAFLNGKRGGTFTEVCGQETWEREEMEAEEENKRRGSAQLAQAEKSKRRSSKWKRSWWKIAGLQWQKRRRLRDAPEEETSFPGRAFQAAKTETPNQFRTAKHCEENEEQQRRWG